MTDDHKGISYFKKLEGLDKSNLMDNQVSDEEFLKLEKISIGDLSQELDLNADVKEKSQLLIEKIYFNPGLKNLLSLSIEMGVLTYVSKSYNQKIDFNSFKKIFSPYDISVAGKQVEKILPIIEKLLKDVKK